MQYVVLTPALKRSTTASTTSASDALPLTNRNTAPVNSRTMRACEISSSVHGVTPEPTSRLVLPSIREQNGETRFKAIGFVNDKVYTAVYTIRDNHIRFISVRRSNKSEERTYRH